MSVFVSNSIFSCIIHGFCSPWKGNAQTKRVSWAPRLHSCHMLNIPFMKGKRKTIPVMFMMKRMRRLQSLGCLHCKWLCVDGKWVLGEVGSTTFQHAMPHKLLTYCPILAEPWKDAVELGEDFWHIRVFGSTLRKSCSLFHGKVVTEELVKEYILSNCCKTAGNNKKAEQLNNPNVWHQWGCSVFISAFFLLLVTNRFFVLVMNLQ